MNESPAIPEEALLHYIDHPVEFTEHCILHSANQHRVKGQEYKVDPQQRDFMNAIAKYPRVGCKSGHQTGKSSSLSWLILWWLFTRPTNELVKVGCTAPTYHQLVDVLWAEVAFWLNQSYIAGYISWTTDKIYLKACPQTVWAVPRTVARGQSGNLQGLHAPHLFMIVDEAFGIEDVEVWTVIDSMLKPTYDNKLAFTGNPTTIVGYAYDAFNRGSSVWEDPLGKLVTMRSDKSTICDPQYPTMLAERYGIHSDMYRVRVLGEFPLGNPEAFIQLVDVQKAMAREVTPSGAVELGVDVARFGPDLTVVVIRQGFHVFPLEILPKAKHTENAEFVIKIVRKYRLLTHFEGVIRVKVDVTGEGSGVVDILQDTPSYAGDRIEVVPVDFRSKNFKSKPHGAEYHDITSYMWGQLRDVIHEVQLPNDNNLGDELAARRFKAEGGMVTIEPKSKFKADYHISPDRSDALVMAFAENVEEKKVITSYNRHNEKLRAPFIIDWNNATEGGNSLHYGAFCQQEDMELKFLASLWDDQTGHLYVYQQAVYDYPTPTIVAADIVKHMQLKHYTCTKIIGNPQMFEEGKKGLAKLINRELPTGIGGQSIRISPARRYEDYGAISLAEQMFAEGRITIHEICSDVGEEVEDWVVDKGKAAVEGHGYCQCLLMTLTALARTYPEIPKMISNREYWRPAKFGVVKIEERESKQGIPT